MATVQQTDGDYPSLQAACAAAESVIDIQGLWTVPDTADAAIIADTVITCDSQSRHPGYWDTAQQHYRLVVSNDNHALQLNGAFTATIDGVAICQDSAALGVSYEGFRCMPNSTDSVIIRDCLIWCSNDIDQQDCIYTGSNKEAGDITVEQCMLWGAGRSGINWHVGLNGAYSGILNVNSCSIWGCATFTSGTSGGIYVPKNSASGTLSVNILNSFIMGTVNSSDLIGTGSSAAGIVWTINDSIVSDTSLAAVVDTGTGNHDEVAIREATAGGDEVLVESLTGTIDLRLIDDANNLAQDLHTNQTGSGLTIPAADIAETARPQNTNYDCGVFEFEPVVAPPTFPDDWTYRQAITIPASKIDADLTDYTVKVFRGMLDDDVVDPSGTPCQADGGDIRFTSDQAGTTGLSCKVVRWALDTTTGAGDAGVIACVKVPSILAASGAVIYLWYKASATVSQPVASDPNFGANNAWDAYWFGDYIDGDGTDYSVNANHLTLTGSPTTGLAGPVVGVQATDYQTTSNYSIRTASVPSVTPDGLTIMGWSTPVDGAVSHYNAGIADGGSSNNYKFINWSNNQNILAANRSAASNQQASSTPFTYDFGVWSQGAGAYRSDHSEIIAYVNAVAGTPNTVTVTPTGINNMSLGGVRDSTPFAGNSTISLFSFHEIQRSAAWIRADHGMVDDPAAFGVPGVPVDVGAPPTPSGMLGSQFITHTPGIRIF